MEKRGVEEWWLQVRVMGYWQSPVGKTCPLLAFAILVLFDDLSNLLSQLQSLLPIQRNLPPALGICQCSVVTVRWHLLCAKAGASPYDKLH